MSDPQSYGDPVDEPKEEAHDVVGRAHEGLADAEAARRDAVDPEAAAAAWKERESGDDSASPAATTTVHDASPVEPRSQTPVSAPATRRSVDLDDEDARWAAYAASAEPDGASADTASAPPAEPVRDEHRSDAAAPAAAAAAGAATAAAPAHTDETRPVGAAQPIFVQAPEAPQPRGNRGAAGLIGLLATVVFAVLYLAATLGLGLLLGTIQAADLADAAVSTLTTWTLWVPTIAFFVGFWFLGAIINRGSWGHWVVWGLVVGVIAWGGYILGALFAAPFWMLTARQGVDVVQESVLAPLAIVAFVLGRELTIWFGAWVAKRGRRVTEINDEAQREYERTLEAGPVLSR
ncbi:ABC transporter [Microbacterium testaceum]|uniref:ABC transporter n=1 Tax=Microbacterium testaceum TaxID=2033 RepID=UPI002260D731|nr:ABC transporter [Microbacterium testaceum]